MTNRPKTVKVREFIAFPNHYKTQTRCGIIPYTFINGKMYFCLGIDKNTSDFTDFGGRKKHGESSIKCAIREFHEESRNIFGKVDEKSITRFRCVYNKDNLIVFVNFAAPEGHGLREVTLRHFKSKCFITSSESKYMELSSIVWVNEDTIKLFFFKRSDANVFGQTRGLVYSWLTRNDITMDGLKYLLGLKK